MAMFGNNTKTTVTHNVELSSANTSIAKGASLRGDLETVGTIRIEGQIYGNVISKEKTSLGESGLVEGNILSQNAEIAGEVKGTVKVVDILTLKKSAIIHGDIYCGKFVVEPGAQFIGKCDMSQPIKEITIGLTKPTNTTKSASTSGTAAKTTSTSTTNDKAKAKPTAS